MENIRAAKNRKRTWNLPIPSLLMAEDYKGRKHRISGSSSCLTRARNTGNSLIFVKMLFREFCIYLSITAIKG